MKVLMLNGSSRPHGCTDAALQAIAAVLAEADMESEILWLGNDPIRDCTACGACAKAPGRCVFDDDIVNRIIDKAAQADGFIFGTPVYYAHPSGRILSVLDRAFYAGKDAFAHKPAAAVASARRAGTIASVDVLNKYFTISSMPVVSSQYWNGVHGDRPEEVRADLEGMQTLRLVGDNMAWLLRSMTAAREAGVVPYEREVRVKTNFYKPEADPNVQGEG